MVKEAEKSSAAALENQNPIPCPRTCGCAFSPVGTLQSLHGFNIEGTLVVFRCKNPILSRVTSFPRTYGDLQKILKSPVSNEIAPYLSQSSSYLAAVSILAMQHVNVYFAIVLIFFRI